MTKTSYTTRPRYDWWFIATVGLAIPGLFAGILIVLAAQGSWTVFAAVGSVGAAVLLLLWSVIPRRYEITSDSIRIVLGTPFAQSFELDTVADVRPTRGLHALAYAGIRYAPSTKTAVEILRRSGLSLVISPQDPAAFVAAARRAMESPNP